MLPKENRLQSRDFKIVYKQGKKYRGKYGMLIVTRNNTEQESRIGFVVSKKIGNAVMRHRMTRILREICRDIFKNREKEKGFKCIYVAFEYCNSFVVLRDELSKHFKNAFRDF